jgi:hypothetical protein
MQKDKNKGRNKRKMVNLFLTKKMNFLTRISYCLNMEQSGSLGAQRKSRGPIVNRMGGVRPQIRKFLNFFLYTTTDHFLAVLSRPDWPFRAHFFSTLLCVRLTTIFCLCEKRRTEKKLFSPW